MICDNLCSRELRRTIDKSEISGSNREGMLTLQTPWGDNGVIVKNQLTENQSITQEWGEEKISNGVMNRRKKVITYLRHPPSHFDLRF
jgi:hypothetical protein